MAYFKTLKNFSAKKEDKSFTAGEVVELTVKRATDINKQTQDKYGFDVLERVEEGEAHADDTGGSTEAEV